MSVRMVTFGDICEFKYGKALSAQVRNNGNVAVFGSNGQVGTHDVHLSTGPTIIIGRKGSVGEVHYCEGPNWPIDTTYYIEQSATECHLRWLAYALKASRIRTLNKAAAVPGLNRNDAYLEPVALPPLDEQKRIAAILDKADALRAKRRHAITLLDSLTQSIFLEMFGDLTTGTRKWPTLPLWEVAEVGSGITKGRKLTSTEAVEVPYLAVANVQDKALNLTTVKTIEVTRSEIERYRLETNDLLLTEGGDPDKLGRGTLWRGELPLAIHQNHIFRVRFVSPQIEPLYANWLIGSAYGKSFFLKSAKQTTGIASINKSQLSDFPIILPPLDLQRAFVKRAEAISTQMVAQVKHKVSLDRAFAALGSLAFRGEI